TPKSFALVCRYSRSNAARSFIEVRTISLVMSCGVIAGQIRRTSFICNDENRSAEVSGRRRRKSDIATCEHRKWSNSVIKERSGRSRSIPPSISSVIPYGCRRHLGTNVRRRVFELLESRRARVVAQGTVYFFPLALALKRSRPSCG